MVLGGGKIVVLEINYAKAGKIMEPKMEGVNKNEQKLEDTNKEKYDESLKDMNDFLDRVEADPSISIGIFHHEINEDGGIDESPLFQTFYEYSPAEKKFISRGINFSNDKKDFYSFTREQLINDAFNGSNMVTRVKLFEDVGKSSRECSASFTIES